MSESGGSDQHMSIASTNTTRVNGDRRSRKVKVAPKEELTSNGFEFNDKSNPIGPQMRLLESSKATDRSNGLQQLAEALREDSSKIAASLDAAAWEHLVSWAARILTKETQTYVNRHSDEDPNEISAAAERLRGRIQTQYLSHIRHIWAVAQPYLSERGAKVLIKYIISSITDDPCLIHVLGADYGKILGAWAAFEPHIRSCKDGRIETLVDLCIKWLMPEFNDISPDSKVASIEPIRKSSNVVLPGDVEYVSMLLSIIRCASPIQLDKLGTKVLGFCAEYFRVYTRENACTAMIMDTANTIILAQPDKQMIGDSGQLLQSLLESSVQLWTTRLPHLKLPVLYNIRILTRILTPGLARLKEPDSKLIRLFEWTLKALMSGDWARFDFMKLPTQMLTIWPVVSTRRRGSGTSLPLFPLQRLAKIASVIDAYQIAFFDTLAFLVTTLTSCQNKSSRYQDPQEHRRKRQRAAPSSLFRLLELLKQTGEPKDAIKAAQVAWFVANFYASALGADEQQDILEAIQRRVLKTEFVKDSDAGLRPWIWGVYVSFMTDSPHMTTALTLESHMRDSKVLAGYNVFDCLKEGVPGAGALAFLLLHGAAVNVPAADVREFCGSVAELLALVGSGSQPDVLQLRILLAHFFKGREITKDIESSIVSICTYAAEHHWSLHAFSFIIQEAFGFTGLSTDEIDEPSTAAILQPQWRMEILFLQHILQIVDAFVDGPQISQTLHGLEEECNPNRDTISASNANKSNLASNLTPSQWDQVANLIVRGRTTDSLFGHQLKYTPENVYPYLALTTHHICHYVEDTATTFDSNVGGEFSERLLAILTDADGFAHAWETLSVISPWLKAYSSIANLEEPMNQLLDVLFDPSNPARLCTLVSGSSAAVSGSHSKASNPFSLSTTNSAMLSADAARKQCDKNLEMVMLSSVSGLANKPWSPVMDTLTVLLMTNEELEQTVSKKIGNMVDKMDMLSFLQCCEFLAHCISLSSSSSSSSQIQLMGKLRARFLACLESYRYVGHMPAMFCILQATKVFSGYAAKDTDANEYITQLFEWVAEEIQNGRVDPIVAIHFMRTIVGPWGRQKDTSLCNLLKDSSLDPNAILVRQAQTSSSFSVRVVVEEELARYQLFLPHLLPNGSLDYPDAPATGAAGTPAVDDMLVLMTRDIGLAMLVCKVGHIVPGVLSILLRQVHSQSECSEAVTRLCHRLLGFISRVIGYEQPIDMIQGHTASLINLDPNLRVFVGDYLREQMTTEQQDRLLFEAVVSCIFKDDLDGAKACWELTGGDSASTGGKEAISWPTETLAHLLVLSVNDPEKFKQVDMDVFYTSPVSDQIQKAMSERPEELIMHVLSLCRPAVAIAYDIKQVLEATSSSEQSQRQLPLAHAYFKCICEESGGNLGATRLSQWGQFYEPQMLVKTVHYIAQNSTMAVPLEEFLTTSRIAWIIIHLHFKLKKMAPGDVKSHLATALNMLIGSANPTLIAAPLVQPLLFRALIDCWQCGELNTSVHMCLAACLLLDMVNLRDRNGAGPLFSDLSVGYLTKFTKLLVTHSLKAPPEQAIQPFGCLLRTVAMATGSTGVADGYKVYIGQDIQPYYSWDDFPTLLVTDHIVRSSDDRAGLANIASRAAALLDTNYYAPSCAEALIKSIERLLQLALPMERTANETLPSLVYSVDLASQFGNECDDPSRAGYGDASGMQLDLTSDVLSQLFSVYKVVLRFTRKASNLEHSKKSTTAMLLRTVSLLQTIQISSDSQQQQQLDSSTSEASNNKSKEMESKRFKDGGDLRCVLSEMLTMSRDQKAVLATIQTVTQLSNSGDKDALGEESLNSLVAWQRWVLSDVMTMPPLMADVYNSPSCLRKYVDQKQPLNLLHLESLCDANKSSSLALSELVCSLISYGEYNKYKSALHLIFESPEVATVLLPHVLYDILPQASDDTRQEIAAFLLDFAYNWRVRDPGMAIDIIDKTLAVRELDERYLDIREFFQHLPIALFEVANLAVYLGAPETAAFLLECDLTCTGKQTLSNVEEITVEARSLFREIYISVGNQPAAQLVSPVKNVDDIMNRCQDTGDWSTLLLLQEAQPNFAPVTDSTTDQLQMRDTLLHLGLLNTLLSMSGDATDNICSGGGVSVNGSHSQAMFGASWRLGKWDIPHTPLSHQPLASSCLKAADQFLSLSPIDQPEEAFYSILRLRALGQQTEAEMAAQEYMSSPAAISAITQPAKGLREAWSYRALSMLIPLVRTLGTEDNEDSTSIDEKFVQASRVASFLISKYHDGDSDSTKITSGVLEFIYQANLSLHEIIMRELVTGCSQINKNHVFARYKDAARMAWWASSKTKNWQNSMSYSHRLHYMKDAANYQDKTLHLELLLWNTETLWNSGNRNLAIELLQVHKKKLEDSLSCITLLPDNHDTNDDDAMVITPVAPDPMTMPSVSSSSNLQPLSAMSTCSATYSCSGAPGPESALGSKINWKRSELDAANIHLSRIITTVGKWMDIERKERPTVLWDEYYRKSTKIIENISHPTAWAGRALHALASFAERQCIEMAGTRDDAAINRVRRQKLKELEACRSEISRATSSGAELHKLKAIVRRLEIQVDTDENELEDLRNNIKAFLELAIRSFVKCLECTNAFDSCVYSLFSLIVTNARAPELQRILVPGLLDSVPSSKLIPLVHQVCARLSTENDMFHKTIYHLVTRMAIDYPFHTMYHLFALRNANRTQSTAAMSHRRSDRLSFLPGGEDMEMLRNKAAVEILTDVSGVSTTLHSITEAINNLCSAYIELAVASVPEHNKGDTLGDKIIRFKNTSRLAKMAKHLAPNLPVLTAAQPIGVPRDYSSVPFISSIVKGYSLAGGINLPKTLRLVGSDGKKYKELVKGKDDLRQDAIIQQLFRVMNGVLLPRSTGASANGLGGRGDLSIRTYQVVPLTKRCGVLQWVDNTLPFGAWFQHNEKKYRPDAPPLSKRRLAIHEVHKNKTATAQQKLDIFHEVCSRAPPVFRFFFYEQFSNAQSWFEHRERYIRSAAVSSMAGWVLGIGDRHLQNILIDRSTAEFVHIDLGIAFDMGKLLPIPELVPFRLTREMIDGMGMLGLNGTFKHSCQVSLQAMRDHAHIIITILNVLKVDPLYMWSLVPLRMDKMKRADPSREGGEYVTDRNGALRRRTMTKIAAAGYEDDDEEEDEDIESYNSGKSSSAAVVAAAAEENEEAGRSILHVGQRLKATISVDGQVNELMQQATNPELLSRLFEGWSAWY